MVRALLERRSADIRPGSALGQRRALARPQHYEEFARSWPTDAWIEREGDFAERMNSLPKYVASTDLEEPLEWQNSILLGSDVAAQVSRLKEEPGQDILVYSRVGLMRTLMDAGLVDRVRLWVHPLIVGAGRRLFDHRIAKTELKLAGTTTPKRSRRPGLRVSGAAAAMTILHTRPAASR